MKIVLQLGRNFTIFVHLAYCRSETDWNITILILALSAAIFVKTFSERLTVSRIDVY